MNPITPERFYKLLRESELDYIPLWNNLDKAYMQYCYIEKLCVHIAPDTYDLFATVSGGKSSTVLDELYESKPETPLGELDKILKEMYAGSLVYMFQVDYINEWRCKYESQLKELK